MEKMITIQSSYFYTFLINLFKNLNYLFITLTNLALFLDFLMIQSIKQFD
jgi:hypothetical protein